MRFAGPLVIAASLCGAAAFASERASAAEKGASAQPSSKGDASLLVRRGAWAVLSTSQGGVAVESRVEVLQDGKAGQRVLVRGSMWPQPIAARVIGNALLEPAR
jgi:flagella basal body P-ring formation protein FlgA